MNVGSVRMKLPIKDLDKMERKSSVNIINRSVGGAIIVVPNGLVVLNDLN